MSSRLAERIKYSPLGRLAALPMRLRTGLTPPVRQAGQVLRWLLRSREWANFSYDYDPLGLPVIASRRGALANLVQDGQTGLLVEPGDAAGLAAKLRWAEAQPEALRAMGERCQQAYASALSPAANLQRLLEIYREAGA